MTKKDIYIEITVTNNCNCLCQYCFEGNHTCEPRNINIENRLLLLFIDACKTFDKTKYNSLILSFWGGEPFLNTDFMYKIIESTYTYDFVHYHCYSNGTLFDKFKEFVSKSFFNEIKNRFSILLSYDGEPVHTLKRGNNSNLIFDTAQLLIDNGLMPAFKATLTHDTLDKFPECWKSYLLLREKFGNYIEYYPTLDTATTFTNEHYEIWKDAVVKVAALEYDNIKKINRPLLSWFNNGKKMNCAINNTMHLHNDGNIYLCHGCPYLTDNKKQKFIKGNINTINSIYDVIIEDFDIPVSEKCLKCSATHCAQCHITLINEEDDIHNNWATCRSNDNIRCKFFKYFGYISNILNLAILKINSVSK